jgi:putative endonuclease
MSTRAVGDRYERLAARFLENKGYRLLAANVVCRGGELDLVCDDAGTKVFVEVRARASSRFGGPEETVRAVKQRRVIHAARQWLARNGGEEQACRFDVIAITVEDGAIEHYVDAFGVTG